MKQTVVRVNQVTDLTGFHPKIVTTSVYEKRTIYERSDGSRYIVSMGRRYPIHDGITGYPTYRVVTKKLKAMSGKELLEMLEKRIGEKHDPR